MKAVQSRKQDENDGRSGTVIRMALNKGSRDYNSNNEREKECRQKQTMKNGQIASNNFHERVQASINDGSKNRGRKGDNER